MFIGVRFVLIGFDPVSEAQYHSELVNGEGVDVGRYDPSCTHVIVHGRVFDDPVCIAAKHDGKRLVTESWVEDSLESGIIADATRILYRPVKDSKGIPGAESLHICLTGYQRQDRDDIMKMVEMMGAQFSKPLIAAKVTHLICYKFEGEKYELAKKMGKNLVNHRWLEDCLKMWEILPVDNYCKSSRELELMEAEAKDSEDEAVPDVEWLGNHDNSETQFPSSELPTPVREIPKSKPEKTTEKGIAALTEDMPVSTNELIATPYNRNYHGRTSAVGDVDDKGQEELRATCAYPHAREDNERGAFSPRVCHNASFPGSRSVGVNNQSTSSSSSLRTNKMSQYSEEITEKSGNLSNSRKVSRNPQSLTKQLNHQFFSPKVQAEKSGEHVCQSTQFSSKEVESGFKAVQIPNQIIISEEYPREIKSNFLPQKRKTNLLNTELNSPNRKNLSPTTADRSLKEDPNLRVIVDPQRDPFLNNNDPSNVIDAETEMSNQPAVPSEIKSATMVKKSRKRMGPFLRTNDSESICLPIENKIKGLPCHVEPSCTIKQTNNSGKTDYAHTSTGETDMNSMDVEKSAMGLRNDVESVTKENFPELPLGVRADGEGIELSRLHTCPVNDHIVSPNMPRDKLVLSSKLKVGNFEKIQIAVQSASLTGRGCLTPVGKHNQKLAAKRSTSIAHKTKINYSATNASDCMDSSAILSGEAKDGINQPTELAHGAKLPEFTSKASDVAVVGGTLCVDKAVTESKSTNMETSDNLEKQKMDELYNQVVPGMVINGGKCHSIDRVQSNNSGVCEKELLFEDAKLEKKQESSDSVKKDASNFAAKSCNAQNVIPNDRYIDQAKFKNPTKKGKATCKVLGVSLMKLKDMPHKSSKTTSKTPMQNEEKHSDAEKENRPAESGGFCPTSNITCNEKASLLSLRKSISNHVAENNTDDLDSSGGSRVATCESVWFILSGHRLQRKEFQQVIRRLNGRFCRDSHQWSYQATHFIVPDPVRRTEKFFAAVAAGRWILKTDYLTASSQASRFVEEEPFEWHTKGLSEDGAISLEAPRKWRLLKERTGHGAFYGMGVLVYGECIAPSLDTLKRVLKAGDGSILATSPPYTRFLKSSIDFAVISQGILRSDFWIQEFLRHEIPCILADYLVDFVCKPGYPLEQHVLFKTHAWADRSFKNILSHLEEVVPVLVPSKQDDDDDIACIVCGSRERGDVMLICGDEEGSAGCGTGTHIDCCNPPLEAVPEDDWFCSKCSSMPVSAESKKASRKRSGMTVSANSKKGSRKCR